MKKIFDCAVCKKHGYSECDCGPDYPDLGVTVAKLRRKAETVCIVHRAVARREHGLAVLAAITAKNGKVCTRALEEPAKRRSCHYVLARPQIVRRSGWGLLSGNNRHATL